jgi:hypothetical protein
LMRFGGQLHNAGGGFFCKGEMAHAFHVVSLATKVNGQRP